MIQRLDHIAKRADQKKHLLPLLALIALLLAWHSVEAAGVARPDSPLYERTLELMRQGNGYYGAAKQAFSEVFGYLPSQVRSVRLPTEFWLLSLLPPDLWRWATALPAFFSLWAAYWIARRRHAFQGLVGVALVGSWLWLATNTLYLHAELWGLPFALAAVAFAIKQRWAPMVVCATAAVLFRETYGLLFVLLVAYRPRKLWIPAFAVLLGAGIAHWRYASRILSASGSETPLNGLHDIGPTITTFTFQLHTLGRLIGILVVVVALIALASVVRTDRLAQLILLHSVVFATVCIFFGRLYWGLVFGPLLWASAPWISDALRNRRPTNE